MNKATIKIAVQKSGRLSEASLDFLRSQGLVFEENGRSLMIACENKPVELLFVRDDDIPEYVSRNAADFGIVGKNVFLEKGAPANVIQEFDFGICELVIAVPNDSNIKKPIGLEGMRIASSYPVLLRRYLRERDINAAIIPIKGAVEVTPKLNLADAICDITQTGNTLLENDLKILDTVLKSQAILISSNFTAFNF